MNIVKGLDIDTAEGSRAYLESCGVDVDLEVSKGMEIIEEIRLKMNFTKDAEWLRELLPEHYVCQVRTNGVHCYSSEGICDDCGKDDHWELIWKAIKQKFGDRFMEIFHQTCTNHKKFTVYLHPKIREELSKATV